MRRLVPLLALGLLSPRPASACSGPCPSPVWWYLAPASGSPIPRDGAVVFEGGRAIDQCLDELAPFLSIEVTRAGVPVPGHVETPEGIDLLVFRPDAPWEAGADYHARVTIDNEGIDPGAGGLCSESTLIAELDFAVSDQFSPPLAAPPAPQVTASTGPISNRYEGVVCCPAATPEDDSTAGCYFQISWPDPGSCAYLYEYTYLSIEPADYVAPSPLHGQLLYDLVVDEVVIAREHTLASLSAIRGNAGCTSFAVTHLGTGVTTRSTEVCTPPDVAAQLGMHLRDVAAELNCADPLLCGGEYAWDPVQCSAFDPKAPPPPPPYEGLYPDTQLESCLGSSDPTGGPETSGSSSGGGETAGTSDTLPEPGCGCTQSSDHTALMGFALLGLWRRRRSIR